MADLTIETYAMCANMENSSVQYIGGYKQVLYHGRGRNDDCTCPAYRFTKSDRFHQKKPCKHLLEAYKNDCHWHGAYSDEVQEQKGICPVCGGPTVYVRVGV